jgi:hypothetical protein
MISRLSDLIDAVPESNCESSFRARFARPDSRAYRFSRQALRLRHTLVQTSNAHVAVARGRHGVGNAPTRNTSVRH